MKKIVLISLLALLVIGLLSIPVLMPLAKEVRSRQHLSSAIELKASGDDLQAFFKIQSALHLSPDSEELLALIGPYAAAVSHPEAIRWWNRAARRDLLSDEELVDLVEYGLEVNRWELVQPHLKALLRKHPEDLDIQLLQLRTLRKSGRIQESFKLAEGLVGKGHNGMDVVSAYIQGAFELPELWEPNKPDVLEFLLGASARDDLVGIEAIRVLLQFWAELSPENRQMLEKRLLGHDLAILEDHLILYSIQLAAGADRGAVLESAEKAFVAFTKGLDTATGEGIPGNEEMLASFTDWLIGEEYADAALSYLDTPLVDGNAELFHARQLALVSAGRARDAYNYSLGRNPLSPSRNLLLRAMAQARMGEMKNIDETLALAAEAVNLEEIGWVESVLRGTLELDLLIRMFEKVERTHPKPLPAHIKLLPYYYASGREDQISRILREVDWEKLLKSYVEAVPFLYFDVLLRDDLPRIREIVEHLASERPDVLDFHILLGFVYTLSGDATLGGELVEEAGVSNPVDQRLLQIMLACIHAANGKESLARELIKGIDRRTLLPQERALLSEIL